MNIHVVCFTFPAISPIRFSLVFIKPNTAYCESQMKCPSSHSIQSVRNAFS